MLRRTCLHVLESLWLVAAPCCEMPGEYRPGCCACKEFKNNKMLAESAANFDYQPISLNSVFTSNLRPDSAELFLRLRQVALHVHQAPQSTLRQSINKKISERRRCRGKVFVSFSVELNHTIHNLCDCIHDAIGQSSVEIRISRQVASSVTPGRKKSTWALRGERPLAAHGKALLTA